MCIDELCRRHGVELANLGGILCFRKTRILGSDVVLVKPMTYMNESGQAAAKLRRMFDVDLSRLLVIYDDIDLPLGGVRLRERGSAGSHKGMRSVIQHVGCREFPRLRIGIQPAAAHTTDIVRYVLTPLRGQPFATLQEGVVRAADAAESILQSDIHSTMNIFNRRKHSLLLHEEEAKSSIRRTHD